MKGESKKERFIRVVEKRVQNAVESIRKISQCSNRRMYEWNENQLKTIWSALESEIKKCKESYKSDQNQIFKLY